MRNRFHGVFSLILFSVAIVIGFFAILNDSFTSGVVYVGLVAISVLIILYAYCVKCEIREDSCRHVIPGKIASMMPRRASGRYTFLDYGGVALPLVVILGFPQIWLAGHRTLLFLFWVLVVLGLVEILIFVCCGCGNRKCPICALRND